MDFEVVFKTVIGLDVHSAQITACAIWADADEQPQHRFQTFGATATQKELRRLASWSAQFKPELIVMESTSVYWKSVYRELEEKRLKMAIAHKILKTIFVFLKRKEAYRGSSVNYEEWTVKRRADSI